MLSFFKLVDKKLFKNYVVDTKICTRTTLDKKLDKMVKYGLIEITKNNIRAKRKLVEMYGNSIGRTNARKSIDITYSTKAFLIFYTVVRENRNDLFVLQDENYKHLHSKKIYRATFYDYIVGRIYGESPKAFKKRIDTLYRTEIRNSLCYAKYDINIYLPIEYGERFKKEINKMLKELYDIRFIYY